MWKLVSFHILDPRGGRPSSQLTVQRHEGLVGAFNQYLDVPIREVPGESSEAEASRRPPDEPPESYPLHQAVDEESRSRHLPPA